MRIVQVLIPEGATGTVLGVLDEEDIDYAAFDEIGRGDFEAMVQFPIPPNGVEYVLERLVDAGIDQDSYTIVLAAETVISRQLSELKERFPGLRISREELHARAQDLAPANSTFFAFLILSTIIATTGLLLDSAATIIGAMVVAPLMGPAISASVGTVLDDEPMASRGVRLQVVGLVVAILTGAAVGVLVDQTVLVPPDLDILEVPEIVERTSPNFLSLFLALGSGIAGAIAVMRGSGSSLVGVAIAVALVPPAATAGLGLAWGDTAVFLGATILVVVNLLAINISALIIFYLSGFRPLERPSSTGIRRRLLFRIGLIAVAILLLSTILGAVTWTTFQSHAVKQDTELVVETVFEQTEADQSVEILELTVTYGAVDYVLDGPVHVEILLGVPRDVGRPVNLAQLFDDALTQRLDREFVVRIEFVEEQVSEAYRVESTDRLQFHANPPSRASHSVT